MAFSLTLPHSSPASLLRSTQTKTPSAPHHLRRRRLQWLPVAAAETTANPEAPSPPERVVASDGDERLKECVKVLKASAKTRKVPSAEVLAALAAVKSAKVDPANFLETLGGEESPGRTWMLIFTAKGQLDKGQYFPVTAVQRFDAAAKRIENGVYLGPLGCLTFEGRFSWKKRILAFIFESIRIKIGPFAPLQLGLGGGDREPTTKDPFFIWFYIDEEIAVAQGRGGGVALWCRCRRVA